MNEAKISEIFMSYQGEGPYLGARQLFIRFYGCSFGCTFCDTKPHSYQIYTKERLLGEVLEYNEPYHSISLTGGEPLEQVAFLAEFLNHLKKVIEKRVYLETNGILHEEVKHIINNIYIISMDIKLPSSTKRRAAWHEHKEFLEIAKTKDIFIKVIVTEKTDFNDLLMAKDIVERINRKIPFVLQPVDPVCEIKEPYYEKLFRFKNELDKDLEDVRIMPQWHKVAGIK